MVGKGTASVVTPYPLPWRSLPRWCTAKTCLTAPGAIERGDSHKETFDRRGKPVDREFTRRQLGKELAKAVLQVGIPPALVLAIGPRIFPQIKERIEKLVPFLKGHEEPAHHLPPPVQDYQASKHRYGFGVNTQVCIGCGRCVRACKLENHVPLKGIAYRTWVERYFVTEDRRAYADSPAGGLESFPAKEEMPELKEASINRSFFVPKLCNQCDNSPCTQVCPVGATFKTVDGIVLVDRSRCVGCGYCIQTCPYAARFKHPTLHVADKCTWCYHRITRRLRPACVEACPRHARIFGDLNDPESDIRNFLRQEDIYVMKEEMGTNPRCFYTGYRLGVT
jgi:tetrathionate reductase subunit B